MQQPKPGILRIGCSPRRTLAGALVLSMRFTVTAFRASKLNSRRAFVYHAGLSVVVVAGLSRAIQGARQWSEVLVALACLLLVGIALSNSWQLVWSHESDLP
jgi:hypothetical protein